mgnify:CR=1 FL=1
MNDHDKRYLDAAILERDDKGVSKASGVLSLVFRKTLGELGVNATMWNKLMLNYLSDKRNRIPNNSRARSSTRGNLNKELSKPNMTWRNFEKGIRFLNPLEAVFTLRLTWRNGKTTVHDIRLLGEAPEGQHVEPVYLPDTSELELLEKLGHHPGHNLMGDQEILLAEQLEEKGYLEPILVIPKAKSINAEKRWALNEEGWRMLGGSD